MVTVAEHYSCWQLGDAISTVCLSGSSHLHHCMEEAQDIHQRPECRVGAVCQHLLVDLAVALVQVELEAIGRLSHNLRTARTPTQLICPPVPPDVRHPLPGLFGSKAQELKAADHKW